MKITRKIELFVSNKEKEKKDEAWNFLRNINKKLFMAANDIVNHQFANDFITDRFRLSDEEYQKQKNEIEDILEQKQKLKALLTESKEIKKLDKELDVLNKSKNKLDKETDRRAIAQFYTNNTSVQNTTYDYAANKYKRNIPSTIIASLNDEIFKFYKNEKIDVIKKGIRSLRTYKKGLPIPFSKKYLVIKKNEDGYWFKWINNCQFGLNFGKDKSNNKVIIDNFLSGNYKVCDSSIQIKEKKIFLLLVVDIPETKRNPDKNIILGVDLGITIPAYIALNNRIARKAIGNKDEFLKLRQQMQSRKSRLQKALTLCRGGKGRKKKLSGLDRCRDMERNFVRTYNHYVSKNIIDFAVKYNAGVIQLEFLKGFGEEEKNKFILRNWSYFELQTMIEYKAKLNSIEVRYVDPYHTSQTCAICDHYEEGQREKQEKFICKNPDCQNYGVVVNADYNAALNIAKSKQYVKSVEECQFYTIKHNNSSKNEKSDVL